MFCVDLKEKAFLIDKKGKVWDGVPMLIMLPKNLIAVCGT